MAKDFWSQSKQDMLQSKMQEEGVLEEEEEEEKVRELFLPKISNHLCTLLLLWHDSKWAAGEVRRSGQVRSKCQKGIVEVRRGQVRSEGLACSSQIMKMSGRVCR